MFSTSKSKNTNCFQIPEMGDLLQFLTTEEDLLQDVLLQLDPKDLYSLELSCKSFREFMVRTQTWRKKLEQDFWEPQNIKQVIMKTEAGHLSAPIDLHVHYKRMYAEHEEAVAVFQWRKFCQSWMTIMTISSMYTFLHPEADEDVDDL